MIRYVLFFSLFALTARAQQQPPMTWYKTHATGVLLGHNIQLLDSNLHVVKDISYLNEQSVDIMEVSVHFYKQNVGDAHCDELKYVKIKTKDIEGIVDGRKLYTPAKCIQNKTITVAGNQLRFITTVSFGVGPAEDDGLTGCTVYDPVWFIDRNGKYEGLVRMVKNKLYTADYPYLELKADDSAYDEVEKVAMQGNNYLVSIKRTLQEGSAKFLVKISKDKNSKYIAEILNLSK